MGSSTPPPITSLAYAQSLDASDPLSSYRSRFYIPTIDDLNRPTLAPSSSSSTSPQSTYLCGNSLGLQPISTAEYIGTFLTQWRTKAVKGHFTSHSDSSLAPFLDIDDAAAELMAPIVSALPSEVAVMGTLTSNLHLMMSSFYRPNAKKYKILLEGKAFPSDHFAIGSQIRLAGYDAEDGMVLMEASDRDEPVLRTEDIQEAITRHKDELALVLLPGVQFYTGQALDVQAITAHAHECGVIIGWDMAHAAGNVLLKLHDWEVDFAVWCTYKYLNSGPGAIAGLFVHEKHGSLDESGSTLETRYRPRLEGWWGDSKDGRFKMSNQFVPREGAKGYQLSNPSALDTAAVVASLKIFEQVGMEQLREKSLKLTGYLEDLLAEMRRAGLARKFSLITPRSTKERGAQLSLRLAPGLLDGVLKSLDSNGVVVDERKPDVIRVAPAPLYNTFEDVWNFCRVLKDAITGPE